jgi:hypothetical protein
MKLDEKRGCVGEAVQEKAQPEEIKQPPPLEGLTLYTCIVLAELTKSKGIKKELDRSYLYLISEGVWHSYTPTATSAHLAAS